MKRNQLFQELKKDGGGWGRCTGEIIQAEGQVCKGSEAVKTKCFPETESKKAWLEQLNKRPVGSMRDVGKTKTVLLFEKLPWLLYTLHCTIFRDQLPGESNKKLMLISELREGGG